MHAKNIVKDLLEEVCEFIHAKRVNSLEAGVLGLLEGRKLTLTSVGRSIKNESKTKSNIHKIDELLGNGHLQKEQTGIYARISKKLLLMREALIIVDWSPVPNGSRHLLRAALVVEGNRSFPLYQKIYEEKYLGSQKAHLELLNQLKNMLPKGCTPILITDAGFLGAWFKSILKLKWHFVGRIRGVRQYREIGDRDWKECRGLHRKAKEKPEYIGTVELGKKSQTLCSLYSYRKHSKQRIAKTKKGKKRKDSYSQKHSKSQKEPWILASSLEGKTKQMIAARIINIYKTRMHIEEGFRDIKSQRTGFALKETRSKDIGRIEILLLLAVLATWVIWMIGIAAEKQELQYQFQANTIRSHRVLSLFFLGLEIIRHHKWLIDPHILKEIKKSIHLYTFCGSTVNLLKL